MDEIKPVAVVVPMYSIVWVGSGPIAWVIEDHGIKVGDSLYSQKTIDNLLSEVAELRAKTACTLGVGDGGGRLFVHGDYDSIKAAQSLILSAP